MPDHIQIARKAVKVAALPLGMFSPRRSGDVTILLYHRVGGKDGEIDMPLDLFDRHLAWLSAHERVVSLDQALSSPEGGVVVTFDDGSRDFFVSALGPLIAHRIPTLLYLATGLVGDESSPEHRPDGFGWGDLRDAISTGWVSVGSHTHSHRSLVNASRSQADEEMRRSKELIEDRLSVACRHFAYPFAVGSAGADAAARDLFDTAALDAWVPNRAGRFDPHRLGRVPILRSDGYHFFRAKVRGILNSEALAYRALHRGPWSHA